MTPEVELKVWPWASLAVSLLKLAQLGVWVFIPIEGLQQQQLPRMSRHFVAIRAFRVAQIIYTAVDSNDIFALGSAKQSRFRLIKMVATARMSFQHNGQPTIKEFCFPFR